MKIMAGHILKLLLMYFGHSGQLIRPVVCHRREKQAQDIPFRITEMWATRHKTLPPCLTHCKSTFHSVLRSWNSHAVLISYTSSHETLSPKWNFTKTFNLVPFPWRAASTELFFNNMSCNMMAPKKLISLPTLYTFFEFLKIGSLVIRKKIFKNLKMYKLATQHTPRTETLASESWALREC